MELTGMYFVSMHEDAPVMRFADYHVLLHLVGHSGEVFATRFDPTGQNIASGGMDRSISMR